MILFGIFPREATQHLLYYVLLTQIKQNFTIPDGKGGKTEVLVQHHERIKIATDLIHFSSYRYTWFLLITKFIRDIYIYIYFFFFFSFRK